MGNTKEKDVETMSTSVVRATLSTMSTIIRFVKNLLLLSLNYRAGDRYELRKEIIHKSGTMLITRV